MKLELEKEGTCEEEAIEDGSRKREDFGSN